MMTRYAPLSLILGLALTGCTDHTKADDGPDMTPPEEPQPEPQVDAQGSYRINSTFDIATNMPGGSGSIVNGLIAATDDPDDPMSWVVDQMLNQMDDSTFKDVLVAVKPFVIGYLNDKVTELAPDLVNTLTQVGLNMADLMKHFGVNERLDVNLVDQTYAGKITVDGVRFSVAGVTTDMVFAQNDIDDVVVPAVLVTLEAQTKLRLGDHTLHLPYGKILPIALDTAVIPAIDPTATSLADLLDNSVDCAGIGSNLASQLPLGNAAFCGSVCLAGLDKAADAIYAQLADPATVLDLHLLGEARAVDANPKDYKIEELTGGTYTGDTSYWGTPAPLALPATWVGKRINNVP
jgi:hypothetical protein